MNSILFFLCKIFIHRYMYFTKRLKRPIIFLVISKFLFILWKSRIKSSGNSRDFFRLIIIFPDSLEKNNNAAFVEFAHDDAKFLMIVIGMREYGVPSLSFAKQNRMRIRPPVNHTSKREIRARIYFTWPASS